MNRQKRNSDTKKFLFVVVMVLTFGVGLISCGPQACGEAAVTECHNGGGEFDYSDCTCYK